jgi:hypothetical protein
MNSGVAGSSGSNAPAIPIVNATDPATKKSARTTGDPCS